MSEIVNGPPEMVEMLRGQGQPDLAANMTKRELFAAMQMAGQQADNRTCETATMRAEWAVECADALLAALAEKPEGEA